MHLIRLLILPALVVPLALTPIAPVSPVLAMDRDALSQPPPSGKKKSNPQAKAKYQSCLAELERLKHRLDVILERLDELKPFLTGGNKKEAERARRNIRMYEGEAAEVRQHIHDKKSLCAIFKSYT